MKKSIGILLLVFAVILSFTACGGDNAMSETDKAKSTVDGFYGALKNFNITELSKYLPADKKDAIEEEDFGEDEDLELAKKMFSKIDAKYKSGEIEEDASSGTLKYTITAIDFSDLFVQLLSVELTESGDPDLSSVDWDNIKTIDVEADIDLIKEGENWVIADPDSAMDNIIGGFEDDDLEDAFDLDDDSDYEDDDLFEGDTAVELEGIGSEWEVEGLFKLTVDSVEETEERNEYEDSEPSQVVIITYTYENLGLDSDLIIYPDTVVDEEGEVGTSYFIDSEAYPQSVPQGSKQVGAKQSFGLNNESDTIKIYFREYGNGFDEHKVTFTVPISK